MTRIRAFTSFTQTRDQEQNPCPQTTFMMAKVMKFTCFHNLRGQKAAIQLVSSCKASETFHTRRDHVQKNNQFQVSGYKGHLLNEQNLKKSNQDLAIVSMCSLTFYPW